MVRRKDGPLLQMRAMLKEAMATWEMPPKLEFGRGRRGVRGSAHVETLNRGSWTDMASTSTTADSGSTERPLVSRSTVLILAVVLLAIGIGAQLGEQNARLYLLWGWFGLSVYLVLEGAAEYRSFRQKAKSSTEIMHKLD